MNALSAQISSEPHNKQLYDQAKKLIDKARALSNDYYSTPYSDVDLKCITNSLEGMDQLWNKIKQVYSKEPEQKSEKQSKVEQSVAKKPVDRLYFTETNDIYNNPSGNSPYNTRPIIYESGSPIGGFLKSESAKFNSGEQNTQNSAAPEKETSVKSSLQVNYIQNTARALVAEYHPDPPVTQILDEDDVKENKKDDSWWQKWVNSKSIFVGLTGLLVSEKAIPDPGIRELVEKNEKTIEAFHGRIEYISETMGAVAEGRESSGMLVNELDNVTGGLKKDMLSEQGASMVKNLIEVFHEELGDKKFIQTEVTNSALTTLGLPEEKADE